MSQAITETWDTSNYVEEADRLSSPPENKQAFLIGIANKEEGREAMTCLGS